MGITFVVFGVIGAIESKAIYITFSMVARLLQGLASVGI